MLELYGTARCPYTAELRESLRWRAETFVEHDVEADAEAFARMLALRDGDTTIPVLVDDGRVASVGFQGRTCYAGRNA